MNQRLSSSNDRYEIATTAVEELLRERAILLDENEVLRIEIKVLYDKLERKNRLIDAVLDCIDEAKRQ